MSEATAPDILFRDMCLDGGDSRLPLIIPAWPALSLRDMRPDGGDARLPVVIPACLSPVVEDPSDHRPLELDHRVCRQCRSIPV